MPEGGKCACPRYSSSRFLARPAHYKVGQALPPANSVCSTAEGSLTGIPISTKTFLFVTWRLAGSLPMIWPNRQLAGGSACPTLSAGQAFVALDREMDKAAFGPVWLRDARVARVVAEALLHGDSGRHFYQLRAWVIMPNHVHLLLRPQTELPVVTRWLKGSTARQSNLILGRTGETFWQDESFDHRRGEEELERIVRYVKHNPVNAGLVMNPSDWQWSSAGLAGGSACPTARARS